jgi:acyl-CoA reductase-like NAD-dependent aldehyde dehydrogenase
VLFIMIALPLPLLAGCSGLFGNPREQANGYVVETNRAIDEHNRLFEETRSTYAEVKEAIEAGGDASKETERIAQTRETMQKARDKLEEAREPLSEVRDLNVGPEIREYAGFLSDALDAQLAAEAKEIEFYEILEQNPVLSKNREEALDVLADAGDGYKKAEDNYGRAQKLADANPKLLKES